MAGTIYDAIHYAVFSNFLLLSATKIYRLISTVPKPSLQFFLNVTEQVTHKAIKILCKQTYVYTGCPRRNVRDFGRVFHMFNYTDRTQNTYVQS